MSQRQLRLPLALVPEPVPEVSRCDPSAIASGPPDGYVLVRVGATLVPVPLADTTEKPATATENVSASRQGP